MLQDSRQGITRSDWWSAMSYSLTPLYDAIASSGISPPDTIFPDGKIHRFGRKKSSWYVAFLEPVKTIVFGDWKMGFTSKYIDTDKPISDYQKKQINREIQKAARQRLQELEKAQREAATLCDTIWKNAKPAKGHPYLERKKVIEYRLRVVG